MKEENAPGRSRRKRLDARVTLARLPLARLALALSFAGHAAALALAAWLASLTPAAPGPTPPATSS